MQIARLFSLVAALAGNFCLSAAPGAAGQAAEGAAPAPAEAVGAALARAAPDLVQRAETLVPVAEAEAAFLDLPEPDVLQWLPGTVTPEGALGWHAALTGQAITASAMNRAEDWLMLARLARQMAESWTDEDGTAVTTAPLARAALSAMAAAAGLRALERLDTTRPDDARRAGEAVLAIAAVRAAAGDGDSAVRVLSAARRDPALAADPQVAAALAALGALAPRPPAPLPAEAEAVRHGVWALVCANDLRCTASLTTPAFVLRLSRPAGPAGALRISFVLAGRDGAGNPWPQRRPGDPPVMAEVRLRIGGTGLDGTGAEDLPLRSHPALFGGLAFSDVPPLALDPVLAALLAEPSLTVGTGRSGAGIEVPLDGLAAVLARMDAVQGREGTVTALVAQGPAGAEAVPLPPLLPLVLAPGEAEPGRALAARPDAGVLALWHRLCPLTDDEPPLAPVNTHTADGADIWLLPCADGGDEPTPFAALYRKAGQTDALLDGFAPGRGLPPRPMLLTFPQLGPWQGSGLAAQGPEDAPSPDAARPLALSAQQGPGCPGLRRWVWTGRGFQLASATASPGCAPTPLPSESFVALVGKAPS
jgi:hypothetical protein